MFSIYLPSKLLVRLAIHDPEKEYSSYNEKILDVILKKQTKIHIYGDDAVQLINEMRNTVLMDYSDPHCDAAFIYLRYIRNASCQIDNCSDMIKSIEKDNSEILKYNGAFFLFDKSVNVDVQKIREEYGILCQPSDDIDMEELSGEVLKFYFEAGERTDLDWSKMLEPIRNLPNNSLCITDRFLFGGDRYFIDSKETGERHWRYDGIDNVCDIIKSLMPQGLQSRYQVNLFVGLENLGCHKDMSLEEIQDKFKTRLSCLSHLPEVNIFAMKLKEDKDEKDKDNPKYYYSKLTHGRRVFTPYLFAEASNGISISRKGALSDNGDKSNYTQSIVISHLFTTGLNNNVCSPDAVVVSNFCKNFKCFIEDIANKETHGIKCVFCSSNGETDLLKYLENNKIWLMEYAKE